MWYAIAKIGKLVCLAIGILILALSLSNGDEHVQMFGLLLMIFGAQKDQLD